MGTKSALLNFLSLETLTKVHPAKIFLSQIIFYLVQRLILTLINYNCISIIVEVLSDMNNVVFERTFQI